MQRQLAGPTVVIGGAQKSATTSLFHLMEQHPDVFAPALKEPQFFAFGPEQQWQGPGAETFARSLVRSGDDYARLFAAGVQHAHRLEASTMYLSEPEAPERLAAFDPDVRVIFVLRDPADRAYSAFNYLRRREWEPLESLIDAVDAEEQRARDGWAPYFGYLRLSSYGDHLRRWFDVFGPDRVLCVNYAALSSDPEGVLARVHDFAGLADFGGYHTGVRHNASGQPKFRRFARVLDSQSSVKRRLRQLAPDALHRGVVAVRNWNLVAPEGLAASDRAVLVERLSPQISTVGELLGHDFVAGWDAV